MTEPSSDAQADLTRLRKLVSKKKSDELEAAWMEAISREGADAQGLLLVLETIARREESGVADSLFWFMLSEMAERLGPEEGVQLVRQAAGFLVGSGNVREEAAAVYEKACASTAEIRTVTEMTVLNASVPFAVAIKRLDKLLKLRPGTCAIDTQHEKIGQVLQLDAGKKTVEMSFADGPRSYDRVAIDKLEPLERGDFRSRIVLDRASLEKMAREDPAELVKTILRTYGPRLELRELKEHLKEIVPGSSWSKFWAQAKVQVKRDPLIEMPDQPQPWLFLRSRAVAYEDELKAAFAAAPSAEEKLVTVLQYLDECGDKAPDAGVLQHFGRELATLVGKWRESEPAMAIGALAVSGELKRHVPDVAAPDPHLLEPLLFGAGDLAALLRQVQNDRLARCMLEYIRATLHSSWHEVWAAVLPGCSQTICEWVADSLLEKGYTTDLRRALAVVMARPENHPHALAWLWKALCGGKLAEACGDIRRIDAALGLLTAASVLVKEVSQRSAEEQSTLAQLRHAISARNYEWFLAALRETDTDGAARAFRAAERNFVLGDHMRLRVMELITQSHPKLFFEVVPPWEEDVVYTTAKGLKKYQAEFAHLVNVKVMANAKAIGEAAARGDLSENAEFTAALEERNLLTEKAARMEADLKKARLLTPAMTRSDSVTVGSTVVAKSLSDNKIETMTFLGPWDSDPENGVYSYRAALALAFMGRKVGENAELSGEDGSRSWEIMEIRPAELETG